MLGLEATFESSGDFEGDFFACGDLDLFAGAGAHTCAGGRGFDTQRAQAGQADRFPRLQGVHDEVKQAAEDFVTLLLGQRGLVGYQIDELSLADLIALGRCGLSSRGCFGGGLFCWGLSCFFRHGESVTAGTLKSKDYCGFVEMSRNTVCGSGGEEDEG